MPQLLHIEAIAPRARPCDKTNRTAGPGDKQSIVSVTRKSVQTRMVISV
jgi:hypothetical protein